jgi:carbonic anhydrase
MIRNPYGHPRMLSKLVLLAGCLVAVSPTLAAGAWQAISTEPGKRVEIDRSSITRDDKGKTIALGRIILEKPIIDAKTASSYRIVQSLSRYDCTSRSYSTLKRSYFKEEGELLREEEVKAPIDMPVRSGMLDDKLLREVCRPQGGSEAATAARRTADKVNQASGELRRVNEALIQKEVKRALLATPAAEQTKPAAKPVVAARRRAPQAAPASLPRPARQAPAPSARGVRASSPAVPLPWSYTGEQGPEHWGQLKPEYAGCATGKRQSPIDIRDGFRVDLEAIQFNYRPAPFRVIDNGHTIQVEVTGGGSISLLGKRYDLKHLHFHHPAEESVNGRSFAMVAHLVHAADDDGSPSSRYCSKREASKPLIQTIWNNLPLERNQYVAPPESAPRLHAVATGRPALFHLHGLAQHAAVRRRRPLAGTQTATADLARSTGDLCPPVPAQRPTAAGDLRSRDQGITLRR